MRQVLVAAALVGMMLPAMAAWASDSNYNPNAGDNNNNRGNANCRSATQRGDCNDGVNPAPLPLVGAGAFGVAMLAGAGGVVLALRRRNGASV